MSRLLRARCTLAVALTPHSCHRDIKVRSLEAVRIWAGARLNSFDRVAADRNSAMESLERTLLD